MFWIKSCDLISNNWLIFFPLQGSYGIVKLAYNKDDDVQYVSSIVLQGKEFTKVILNGLLFQAMKILSKKKLKRKAGIFGEWKLNIN